MSATLSLFILEYVCKRCGEHAEHAFLSERDREESPEFQNKLCTPCLFEVGSANWVSAPPNALEKKRLGRPPKTK